MIRKVRTWVAGALAAVSLVSGLAVAPSLAATGHSAPAPQAPQNLWAAAKDAPSTTRQVNGETQYLVEWNPKTGSGLYADEATVRGMLTGTAKIERHDGDLLLTDYAQLPIAIQALQPGNAAASTGRLVAAPT